MLWLLDPAVLRRLDYAREHFQDRAKALQWEADAAAAEASAAEARDGLPRGLEVTGNVATIAVEGVLTKRPDFWAEFFGGSNTTYSRIANALGFALNSAEVGEIVFRIDSPGGQADGLVELLDRIGYARRTGGKIMRTRGENALSAAYGIAAAVGNIEASGRASLFGSIGTAVSMYVSPNVVTLTNTESPDKRPDVTTDAGKKVIVKYLDQLNAEFVAAIAEGRGVSSSLVNSSFGRGATMTAAEALKLGLIDSIANHHAPRAAPSSKGNTSMAERDPEMADRAALDAAVQRGIATERDRVLGHLTLGESSGDMAIALEAIRSGAGMTVELTARYMSASMNRKDRGERQTESNQTEAKLAAVNAASPAETSDLGDRVVSVLKGQHGEREFVRG